MAWHPEPRLIRLNGSDAVVLSPGDYERLDGIRRQAGSQAASSHKLRHQLTTASAALDQIAAAIAGTDCAAEAGAAATAGLPEAIREILAAYSAANPARRRARPGQGQRPRRDRQA